MVRAGGGNTGRRGRELPCYRRPTPPTSANHVRPRARCPRPGPDPHNWRWYPMVTTTSTHHQRVPHPTRPSTARTGQPSRPSPPDKAVMPTHNTPTNKPPHRTRPATIPLGGSTTAPPKPEHHSSRTRCIRVPNTLQQASTAAAVLNAISHTRCDGRIRLQHHPAAASPAGQASPSASPNCCTARLFWSEARAWPPARTRATGHSSTPRTPSAPMAA